MKSVSKSGSNLSTRLHRYGSWLACCLSRGQRAPLNPGDIRQLAEEVGEQTYAKGMKVFERGEPAARIHIIRSGSIELSRTINGRRVTLQLLHAGDVFGDVPAFLGDPEPFDARAATDSVILSIEATTLFGLLQTRPKMAKRWFVSLAERMAGLQDRLVDLLAGTLESQVASILLREAGDGAEVRLTHGHLADLLGVPRSSVQRVLKALESADLVALGYGCVDLLDRPGLVTLIADEVS